MPKLRVAAALSAPVLATAAAAILLLGRGAAEPDPNAYSTHVLVSDAYLGAAGASLIEFAMIPGQANQAIVAGQGGLIHRVALDASFAPQPWGDVSDDVTFDGEEGLLSVAFAPDFTSTGRVYLYYTPGSPTPTVLSRYAATLTDLNEASEHPLLNIEEFADNHNGGHIAFDSDGYLYLSVGDGGGSGDPGDNGQALDTLLGKVLRIDPSGASGYAIPPGNPFNDGNGPIREEIFAYGFRNPWRMTVDPLTDDVWLGDVGQNLWEETDLVVAGGNYGWDCYEGDDEFELAGCPAPETMDFPRSVYSHSFGAAVTGGVVYRGTDMPELYGWYIYGDFYSGRIWAVDTESAGGPIQLLDSSFNLASFTLMPDGEVAIVTYNDGVLLLTKAEEDGDGVSTAVDNCPTVANASQQNSDSDPFGDACDNCPMVANAGQANADGDPFGDACDNCPAVATAWPAAVADADCDGYSNSHEADMGTDPNDPCGFTAGGSTPSETWPPDIVPTNTITIQDVLAMKPVFNGVSARHDLLPSGGTITIQDVLSLKPFFNLPCS
jgi:glucose/arabinose dehydrogenase